MNTLLYVVSLLVFHSADLGSCNRLNTNPEPLKGAFFDNSYVLENPLNRLGEEWRLPQDIFPVSYNIQLLPFIEEGNFTTDGYIEMNVMCMEATINITFNSYEITIDQSSISV